MKRYLQEHDSSDEIAYTKIGWPMKKGWTRCKRSMQYLVQMFTTNSTVRTLRLYE